MSNIGFLPLNRVVRVTRPADTAGEVDMVLAGGGGPPAIAASAAAFRFAAFAALVRAAFSQRVSSCDAE